MNILVIIIKKKNEIHTRIKIGYTCIALDTKHNRKVQNMKSTWTLLILVWVKTESPRVKNTTVSDIWESNKNKKEEIFFAFSETFLLIYLLAEIPVNSMVTIPLSWSASDSKKGMYTMFKNIATTTILWCLKLT